MQSAPDYIKISEIKETIEKVSGVQEAHHLHVWQMDDRRVLLEGHIVILEENLSSLELIKAKVREILKKTYSIQHTTLEVETATSRRNHGD